MIRLLAVGYSPQAFVPGRPGVLGYPDGIARAQLDELTGLIAEVVGAGDTVLAILPGWAEGPDRRRLETIRAALDTRRLVIHAADLPPLAGGVFTALVADVAPHVDTPGRLIGALPALARQVVVLARLSRLSGLREPAPTVWQHALSLLPGIHFGVSAHPQPAVVRLTRDRPLMPLPRFPPTLPVALALSAHGGATLDWAHERLVPALGHPPLVEAEPTPLSTVWWGAGKGFEGALYPTDGATTAAAVVPGVRLRLCAGCGLDAPSGACPYCGAPEPHAGEDERPQSDRNRSTPTEGDHSIPRPGLLQ